MEAELLEIHPRNPQERLIRRVVDSLREGGVVIYPTDTVYAIGCDIHNKKAIERLCRIKGVQPEKAKLSCICEDLKIIGEYAIHVSTPAYKLMRRALPGPYTFIVQASKKIPRHFQSSKKTVGIRVPDHPIPTAIVKELGNPIVTASLKSDDDFFEYPVEPAEIFDRFHKLVNIIIDGGSGGTVASTVIDCSNENEISLVREGAGLTGILD